MSTNIKYLITAIGAFLVGFLYYSNRKKQVDTDFNKTLARQKDGRYFLIFNSIVVLSREITKEQYDTFLKQYPSGIAPSNVISDFSSVPARYTTSGGKYFESTWTGSEYNRPIEITEEEYLFLTKNNNAFS